MKFPKLIIENFLAITEAEINLADRGLVGIQGINHADTSATSNGSGKSSIADALCWCWFGVTARGSSGDEIINDDAKKNTRVVSVLEDGHLTYTATRHRKHKTGKNSLTLTVSDGLKTTDLTKGTDKLTQEVANQIIGCSLEVFVGSIYAGQERMPDLPAMTDKNLKVLIEEAAGVTVLEGAYQKAREALNEAQKAVVTVEAGVNSVRSKIEWLDNQIVSTKASEAAWVTNQKTKIDLMRAEVTAVVPILKQYQADIAAMAALDLDKQISDIDAKIAAVGGENVEYARLEQIRSEAAGQLAIHKASLSRANDDLARLHTEEANVAHKVGCPCDECGRPLTTAELADATAAVQSKIKAVSTSITGFASEVALAEKRHADALAARNAFNLTMTDISAATAGRASLAAQLASYNELRREQGAQVAKAKSLRDRITVAEAEVNPFTAEVAKHEIEKTKLEKDLVDIELRLDEARERVELEEAVVKVFGPTGVRARVLDEVTPFLNAQSAKYLATLSDGNIEAVWTTLSKNAKGELREKFSIDVTNATGGKIFKSLSGGEKRKVRIATALALQDLVSTRATKPIELFIGDEIDDAVDPAGLERLTVILEEKARERGSVFVISHNELRDHISQVLLVEKMADKKTRITETVV